MPGTERENRAAFEVGDTVRLADPRLEKKTAEIKIIFTGGDQVLLSVPLANQTIWNVADLVLIKRARDR